MKQMHLLAGLFFSTGGAVCVIMWLETCGNQKFGKIENFSKEMDSTVQKQQKKLCKKILYLFMGGRYAFQKFKHLLILHMEHFCT